MGTECWPLCVVLDKIRIENILGVPCNPGGSLVTKQRWIDNYSHRIDGGNLHVSGFRFGGEGRCRCTPPCSSDADLNLTLN